MIVDLFLIVIGLALLFYGAEFLVRGAARLASSFGIPPLVIGLTLVAFATSAPELLVSVTAALQGSSNLALGNVVGSNIANIALILGVTGLIFPISVNSQVIRREIPIMIGFSLLTYYLVLDGRLSQSNGLLLVAGLIFFNWLSYHLALGAAEGGDVAAESFEEYEEIEQLLEGDGVDRPRELGRVLIGILMLTIGAQAMVDGATGAARALGLSDLVIGITLVAFGTSLPELATSLVSALRDEDDISVGNIIGSNIYNLLAVLGLTSVVRPIPVDPSTLRIEFPIMLAISIAIWPLTLGGRLERWKAALLLGVYVVFTGWLLVG